MTPEEARKQRAVNESASLAASAASPELIAARKVVEVWRNYGYCGDYGELHAALIEYDRVVKG